MNDMISKKIIVNKEQALQGLAEFMAAAAAQGAVPEIAWRIINSDLDHGQLRAIMVVGQIMYDYRGSMYRHDTALRLACGELDWPTNYVIKELRKYHARRLSGFTPVLPHYARTDISQQS